MTSISVVGATGLVGVQILQEAVKLPGANRVRAWIRRPLPLARGATGVVSVEAPAPDDDFWRSEILFVALGTTIGKAGSQVEFRKVDLDLVLECARRARAAGTGTLAVVSAAGADPKSRIFYNRVKGEAEAGLSSFGFPRLLVARPSLLLGDRAERRTGEWIARKCLGSLRGLFPKSVRPVRDLEVASCLVAAAMDRSWEGHRILTNREMVDGCR